MTKWSCNSIVWAVHFESESYMCVRQVPSVKTSAQVSILKQMVWYLPETCNFYCHCHFQVVQTPELCSLFSLLDKLFWQVKPLEEWSTHLVLMTWSPLNSLLLSSELKLRDDIKRQQQHPAEGKKKYFICYNVKFFHIMIFPQDVFMKISVSPVLFLLFFHTRLDQSALCS